MIKPAQKIALAATLLATALLAACNHGPHSKFGYATEVKNDRLYVFAPNSSSHQAFKRSGEMSKSVTRIGAGPNGMTVIAEHDVNLDDFLDKKS